VRRQTDALIEKHRFKECHTGCGHSLIGAHLLLRLYDRTKGTERTP
jgi:hypothetical protein